MGREDILARLVARLTAGGSASVSTGGTGGAGKTTLAVALAHDPRILAHFSEGVLWAALGKDPAIEQILGDWASALGLDVAAMADPADRAQAIKNAVGMRSILFVIDDVWHEEAASLLRCGGPNCAHLLTTRDDGIARAFAGPGATEKVPDLEPDPAFELLQALAPEVCAAAPEDARALATAVGGLPLAIELLGGYLGDPEHAGLAGLRTEALREMADSARRLQLARERLGGRGGERPTLEQTIALSLDDLPADAVQAFYSLGAFAPKPDTFALAAAQAVANAAPACFGILLKRSLIESPDGERLSIHPVITEYARSRIPDEAVTRHREAYAALVNSSNDWRRIEQEYPQVRHAWIQWHDDPRGKVKFRFAIQGYQRLRGLWQDLIDWSEVALGVAQRGELKGDVAALLLSLGLTFKDLGQRQKALEYYERALPIIEEVGDRQGLAATLNNIGGVYDSKGRRQKALEYFERALPIMEEIGDRRGLAVTLNNMGLVYDAQGQRRQALEYYQRALPIMEEVADRRGQAVTMNNVGSVYNAQGERQKALEYFERALPIMEEEVGDRRGLAVTLNNIGHVYAAQGQRLKALEYFEWALPILEEVGDRGGVAVTLNNIGHVYNTLGQYQKALAYYERALRIREEVADRPGLSITLNNIGRVHSACGQPQKALEYYERALAIQLEVGDRAGAAVTRFNIGTIYRREGRLPEAVEQFRLCVALDEAVEDPDLERDRAMLRELEAELAAQAAVATPTPAPTLFDRLRRWFRRGP